LTTINTTDVILTGDVKDTNGNVKYALTSDIPTIGVGTTTTGNAGTTASVSTSTSGTTTNFNFTIPKGDQGVKGNDGTNGTNGTNGTTPTIGVGTTTTGNAGTTASVSATTVGTTTTFAFTIPKGDKGADGADGATGAGLNSSGVLDISKDGEVAKFQPATSGSHTLINFNSKVNSGSDKGFILVQDESAQSPGTGTEDLRMTIGVHNDFRSSTAHSDELWFQGGGRLCYNVGSWDSELNTIIGTPGVGTAHGGVKHEWRVSNAERMTLNNSGLNVSGDVHVGGKLSVTGGNYTEVDINSIIIGFGTWVTGTSGNWGEPKFSTTFNRTRYTDGSGDYVEYIIPTGMKSAYISQLQWSNGGYADIHGVRADASLVFLRRINTQQAVENTNHGGQHDGSTITFIGTGLQTFSRIRITNGLGRLHLTGLAFTPQENDGTEGTGMVHSAQINSNPFFTGTVSATNLRLNADDGIEIRADAPTITFRDTNARSGYIHVNSNFMYFLGSHAVNDAEYGQWTQPNGHWPLTINLINNNAAFGGDIYRYSSLGQTIFYDASETRLAQNNGRLIAAGTNPSPNIRFSIWETNVGGEAAYIAINGDFIAMSSPADSSVALVYKDEDDDRQIFRITAAGAFVQGSDARRKCDIQPIVWENVLEKIANIEPSTFKMRRPETCCRETTKYDTEYIGYIAQNVQESFPELIDLDGDNLMVNTSMMLLPVIQGVQELNRQLQAEKARNDRLETQLASVLARLDALESA
jgi:hypothetical protein